jgi:hypothetical protein
VAEDVLICVGVDVELRVCKQFIAYLILVLKKYVITFFLSFITIGLMMHFIPGIPFIMPLIQQFPSEHPP